ncbi:MAG: hypothetical protein IT416_04445 [Candidatus Pacebacteria bacterium]|nr:hypothetical protein [Candidatus Paceibacterota bacterium]
MKKEESILDILEKEREIKRKQNVKKELQDFFVYPLVILTILCLLSLKGILFIIFFLPIVLFLFYKDRLPSIKTLKEDGSLSAIKYIFLWLIALSVISVCLATIKVVFFEQNKSGMYALTKECIEFDEACIQSCQDTQYDNYGRNSVNCDCCLEYETIPVPIGIRIKDLLKTYLIYSGGIAITFGMIHSSYKGKK